MLVDTNLLLYARNTDDPRHPAARVWLTGALNGTTRVGLPWQVLTGFLRIATNPRAFPKPLTPDAAASQVDAWLAAPAAWVPQPTDRHAEVLGRLMRENALTGPLVADAHLAALAIEHGLTLYSTDADFARFPEVRWYNPLSPGG
jgi:uncharacterized protein